MKTEYSQKISLSYISAHDFLFYSSREYNTRGTLEKFMGNYALNYAVNTNVSEIHRTVTGVSPHYQEDFKEISTYLTPAWPIANSAVMQNAVVSWDTSDTVHFTYNAIGEAITFGMTPAELNFPNIGSYEKFCPLTTFGAFIIGPRRPTVIRWGKKYVPCRIHYFPVSDVKISKGKVHLSHPINTAELPAESRLMGGTVLFVKPVNLVINPEIEGEYLQGKVQGKTVKIGLPRLDLYPSVFSV